MTVGQILEALMRYYDHKWPNAEPIHRGRYQVQAAAVIHDMVDAGLMEGLDEDPSTDG